MKPSPPFPCPGMVLVAPGGQIGLVGPSLARALGLKLQAVFADGEADPAPLLADLLAAPSGWLQPLAVDPGRWLGRPGSWAQALGAWRQPTVVVAAAAMVEGGPAAACSALLQAHGVPLVGLVQVGGNWRAERRRQDGLPWLGWMPAGDAESSWDPGPLLQAHRHAVGRLELAPSGWLPEPRV